MKMIKVDKVKNYRGGPLEVPVFDNTGKRVEEPMVNPTTGEPVLDSAGNPVAIPITKESTIVDLLDCLTLEFPRAKLTNKHSAEIVRLYGKIAECREKNLTELGLEDASYDWLIGVLEDEQIGVQIFGVNLISVLNALGAEVKE